MKKRGWFFSFEGGEGAGKSTLIASLAKVCKERGYETLVTREPGGTSRGEAIRKLLLQKELPGEAPLSPYAELALFLASRAQHVAEVIRPALNRGAIVLCDRFNDSSVVYQGVARGLGKEAVAHVAHFLSEGLEPDLTFYLDLDPKIGLKRAEQRQAADRIEAEKETFHEKVRQGYLDLIKEHPERLFLLDASMEKEEVFASALDAVDAWMEKS